MMARIVVSPAPAPQQPPQRRSRAHRPWARQEPPRRPVAQLMAALPTLPRHMLSRLTTALIDRMDEIDGDPDLEETHDQEGTYD